jgi:hypothetical protein
MYRTRVGSFFVLPALLVAAVLVAGCKGGGDKPVNKESKWVGTYKNTKDNSTLVLQNEHKGTLDMAGQKGEITWEAAGDDKIVVHAGIPISMFQTSDGLRDEEGTIWKKS